MGLELTAYEGAVLYIDMLGFSALTNGEVQLEESDYLHWLNGTPHPHSNQFFAGMLLVKFREILMSLQREVKGVTVSQLSDCCFIWSKQIDQVVTFAFKFMHVALKNGLLCRGGMAYGQIIETGREHRLGRFILGTA
ncbi:MAG: hypothetical protein JST32_22530, partial [Bacteroidetes bacterium]|nr:hypothetical protein [Bacteroidota bacterium]